jgi:DNA-binding transcriptional ArsR family regulator
VDPLAIERVFETSGKVKILLLLIDHEEMNISQIVRLSGLEHSSVQKHLKSLCDRHLLKEKRYGRIRIFALEDRNPYVVLLKRFFADWRHLASERGPGFA